jgi:hypothetical protein
VVEVEGTEEFEGWFLALTDKEAGRLLAWLGFLNKRA